MVMDNGGETDEPGEFLQYFSCLVLGYPDLDVFDVEEVEAGSDNEESEEGDEADERCAEDVEDEESGEEHTPRQASFFSSN